MKLRPYVFDCASTLQEQAVASPEVLAVGYRGESQAFKETGGSIIVVFFLTILLVYLVLAAQFESFVHPITIITTVPLAVGGGIIGLALTGMTLNLYSQIGIVMLVGLAAKNGILIVEFANQLRDEGLEILDAIQQAAARRLRPILMTSIATVFGAIPLAIAGGAGRLVPARHAVSRRRARPRWLAGRSEGGECRHAGCRTGAGRAGHAAGQAG